MAVGKRESYDAWNYEFKSDFIKVELESSQFMLPGFIDTHIHAPQVPNIGLGLDKPLMEWLNAYTFPMETQYKDKEFARHVYRKVIVSRYFSLLIFISSMHKLFIVASNIK